MGGDSNELCNVNLSSSNVHEQGYETQNLFFNIQYSDFAAEKQSGVHKTAD